MNERQRFLSQIPQVDRIIQTEQFKKLCKIFPRNLIVDAIRNEIDKLRKNILNTETKITPEFDTNKFLANLIESIEKKLQPNIKRVINASGIILHTGLGRAPISKVAQQALIEATEGFCTIEYDIESGKRGDRHHIVEDLLIKITGAEAAAVVNNNAAATMIILNTFSFNKESIVSRGELITIGGSFRIPDIMQKSGAKMVEIGTTNHTKTEDYINAITDETALLVKIHTSNYKISGFTAEVTLDQLIETGIKYNLPVFHDLGSGSLIDLGKYGLPKEPVVKESIALGADIVSFSGDKLLGGPQAGIIVGKKKYIDQIKTNQLLRPLRCCKLTFAALEATLRLFFDEQKLFEQHPVLKLLTETDASILNKAKHLKKSLDKIVNKNGQINVEQGLSEVGGGSLATESLSTYLVTLVLHNLKTEQLAYKLRNFIPPIITRIDNNKVVFDLRTVREDEIEYIVQAIQHINS